MDEGLQLWTTKPGTPAGRYLRVSGIRYMSLKT